jgi:hypothetical protein
MPNAIWSVRFTPISLLLRAHISLLSAVITMGLRRQMPPCSSRRTATRATGPAPYVPRVATTTTLARLLFFDLACAIGSTEVRFRENVEPVLFGGEEQDLLCSKAYARELKERCANVTLMVQADMLTCRRSSVCRLRASHLVVFFNCVDVWRFSQDGRTRGDATRVQPVLDVRARAHRRVHGYLLQLQSELLGAGLLRHAGL